MSNYMTRKQIDDATTKDKLRSLFWGFRIPVVSAENQKIVVDRLIEYRDFSPLEGMAKSSKLSNDTLEKVIDNVEIATLPMNQGGFGEVLRHMSKNQLFRFIDALISLDKHIWTSFYQKTLAHNHFRKNGNLVREILEYLITDKKVTYFASHQIIQNIVEKTMVTKDLIDWIIENDAKYNSTLYNILIKQKKLLTIELIEYIYKKENSSNYLKRTAADIMIDLSPDHPILGDMYDKTKEEKFMPKTAKDIFMF